jgi:hypothetical protein
MFIATCVSTVVTRHHQPMRMVLRTPLAVLARARPGVLRAAITGTVCAELTQPVNSRHLTLVTCRWRQLSHTSVPVEINLLQSEWHNDMHKLRLANPVHFDPGIRVFYMKLNIIVR